MEIIPSQIVFQLVNFAILFFLLKKFLYRPILKVLDSRAQRIKEGLEAAQSNLDTHSRLESEKQKLLKKAQEESAKIISQAKVEAQAIKKQARAEAREQAKQALKKEREDLQAQINLQTNEFERRSREFIFEATQAVLRGLVTPKLDQQIIDSQIKNLKQSLPERS